MRNKIDLGDTVVHGKNILLIEETDSMSNKTHYHFYTKAMDEVC